MMAWGNDCELTLLFQLLQPLAERCTQCRTKLPSCWCWLIVSDAVCVPLNLAFFSVHHFLLKLNIEQIDHENENQ
jgi:hypothetical protein